MAKQSKKRDRKKRLLILILLLTISSVMLITATYAWFTSNRSVSVDPIDVNVTTVNGLQISADAINWKAKVTKTDLEGADETGYATARNIFPDTLGAVSSDGVVNAGEMNMFYGIVNADEDGIYRLETSKQTEDVHCSGDEECAGKYFIAFDVFLKVEAETEIVLTSNSSVKASDGNPDRGIKNAARVAFIDEGNLPTGSSSGTVQALKNGSKSIIWEPNQDTHTTAGIENAELNYGISDLTESGASRVAYKGVNQTIDTGNAVALNETGSSPYFTSVTPTIATNYGFVGEQQLLTLQPGTTKIRVYMWVEGQDVDAENNATGTHMTFNLEFAIAE